jgi:hypothetical protein
MYLLSQVSNMSNSMKSFKRLFYKINSWFIKMMWLQCGKISSVNTNPYNFFNLQLIVKQGKLINCLRLFSNNIVLVWYNSNFICCFR